MKIAIVHDSYLHYGGAEKVLHFLLQKYPEADLYIPLISNGYLEQLKKSHKVHSSILSKIPFLQSIQSYLKPIVLLYWSLLDLDSYDLVISSSHSFSSKSVNTQPETLHVSYIHTPPKYLYLERNKTQWINHPLAQILLYPFLSLLRYHDYLSAQKPDLLLCNSVNVQKRIKKYYGRTAKVVYPIQKKRYNNIKRKFPAKNYFLFLSRLEYQKGCELVVKTCTKYSLPLIVVGTGSIEKKLKKIAGKTIVFTGFISEEEKLFLIQNARALLYASIDEDFGIVLNEVLAQGVPVVAYKSGAINEFKSNNLYLFKQFNSHSLYSKIKQLPK